MGSDLSKKNRPQLRRQIASNTSTKPYAASLSRVHGKVRRRTLLSYGEAPHVEKAILLPGLEG
jgi:hypothetical protein